MQSFETIRTFIRNIIQEHKERFNADDIKDLVDLYLEAEANDFKDMGAMDGKLMLLVSYTQKSQIQ